MSLFSPSVQFLLSVELGVKLSLFSFPLVHEACTEIYLWCNRLSIFKYVTPLMNLCILSKCLFSLHVIFDRFVIYNSIFPCPPVSSNLPARTKLL